MGWGGEGGGLTKKSETKKNEARKENGARKKQYEKDWLDYDIQRGLDPEPPPI